MFSVNIQNVLLWLQCRQETSAPLVGGIVSNALFHSNSHINQMLPQIIHPALFRLDALALSRRGWVAGWLAGWLSHSGIVSKPLNLSENFFDHLKATSL